MKKIIIIFLFLLTGCTKNIDLNINKENIISIIYDNTKILNNDFSYIIEKLQTKKFYKLNDDKIKGKKLIITTNDSILNLEVIDNYIILNHNNKKYFANTKDISKIINNIIKKYEDNSFYSIEENKQIDNPDHIIKIENTDKCILFKTNDDIKNFKINLVERNQEEYIDVNLLNQINTIKKDSTICIKSENPNKLHISFDTIYNYNINIIYNKEFIKTIKQK